MSLPPLPSEQLLIDSLDHKTTDQWTLDRVLVISPGRGQAGWQIKSLFPAASVTSWYVDSFRAAQATLAAQDANVSVDVVCSADLPTAEVDVVLVPVLQRGEAEMTRDLLQQAHDRLRIGGVLVASVNNPRDTWLRNQMQTLFDKVTCQQSEGGWVYTAIKHRPLKRLRSFEAEIVFRDGERLLQVVSRPSVFSHRVLDVAARQLIVASEVQPGDRVLDFGCGCGAVGIAAGIRSQTGAVFAVDSNARAIECTRRGAQLNAVDGLTAILNHDGDLPQITDIDVALLNPPYYSNFTIAEHFVATAARLLVDGGRAVVVTKQRDEYHLRKWPLLWLESELEVSGYQLLTYRKRNY